MRPRHQAVDHVAAHVGDRCRRRPRSPSARCAPCRSPCAGSFMTSSKCSRFLRISKLRASTLLLRLLQRLVEPADGSIASSSWPCPSSAPSRAPCCCRRCASGRLPATGRTSTRRDRPGGPSGRAAGCRCAGSRGARCRPRRGRRRLSTISRLRATSALDLRRARASSALRAASSGCLARSPACDAHLDVAAELDVGAAAGHVGGDGDGARPPGLGDDVGFLLVVARVQHAGAGSCAFFSSLDSASDFSIDDRADQHRLLARRGTPRSA